MSSWLQRVAAPLLTVVTLLGGCASTSTGSAPPSAEVWETLAPGLDWRLYRPGSSMLTQLVVLRIDPAYYTFRVHYRPGAPLTLAGWSAALPNAIAFVNANYFDPEHHALGLVVADGVAYGKAYDHFGGMLQVQGDVVRVRSTTREPYQGEALDQAVQAFPMLVTDWKASFFNTQGDRSTRRTVVGQDRQGRIVLITTSSFAGMRLVDLSAYLVTTDLDLAEAVNLDGGGSTLMALNVPGLSPYQIPSVDPVPTVLAIYAR